MVLQKTNAEGPQEGDGGGGGGGGGGGVHHLKGRAWGGRPSAGCLKYYNLVLHPSKRWFISYRIIFISLGIEHLIAQVTNLSLTINISCSCSGGGREAEVARGVAKGVATLLDSKLGKPS